MCEPASVSSWCMGGCVFVHILSADIQGLWLKIVWTGRPAGHFFSCGSPDELFAASLDGGEWREQRGKLSESRGERKYTVGEIGAGREKIRADVNPLNKVKVAGTKRSFSAQISCQQWEVWVTGGSARRAHFIHRGDAAVLHFIVLFATHADSRPCSQIKKVARKYCLANCRLELHLC